MSNLPTSSNGVKDTITIAQNNPKGAIATIAIAACAVAMAAIKAISGNK